MTHQNARKHGGMGPWDHCGMLGISWDHQIKWAWSHEEPKVQISLSWLRQDRKTRKISKCGPVWLDVHMVSVSTHESLVVETYDTSKNHDPSRGFNLSIHLCWGWKNSSWMNSVPSISSTGVKSHEILGVWVKSHHQSKETPIESPFLRGSIVIDIPFNEAWHPMKSPWNRIRSH